MFVVRMIESRELVGLFDAKTINDLALLVDECTSPNECEFMQVEHGGIYWGKCGTPVLDVDGDFEPDDDTSGASFTERLDVDVIDQCRPGYAIAQGEWTTLDLPEINPRSQHA